LTILRGGEYKTKRESSWIKSNKVWLFYRKGKWCYIRREARGDTVLWDGNFMGRSQEEANDFSAWRHFLNTSGLLTGRLPGKPKGK